MNPETRSLARCVNHPSQFFTGFCSSCLVERLSNVDTVVSTQQPSSSNNALEICESGPDSQRIVGGVRVRKTLLSLFQLDDLNELEKKGLVSETCEVGRNSKGLEIAELELKLEPESKDLDNKVWPQSSASGFKKHEPFVNESSKDGSLTLWIYSKIRMRGLKWGKRSINGQMRERCSSIGFGERYVENKSNLHNFCDKASWEKPRHSWDGSIMSKALACSFSCLEDRQDESCKIKRKPDEPASFDLHQSSGANDLSEGNKEILTDHCSLPLPPLSNSGDLLKEELKEGSCHSTEICRKNLHRWSRVWDWSIISPFRDFAKRNEHVLERSFSETWREHHKDRYTKTGHQDAVVRRIGSAMSNARVNRLSNVGVVAVNGDIHGVRSDRQKMREFRLSRSRSAHYSSPRNLENGLLRFYLTPLRTSRRRSMAKCRRRNSESFAKGFFGL